jgi:exportin-2 (importin alpha re-exporter)
VKGLRKHFEKETTEICSAYITSMLTQYATNPQNNWLAKDVAIYLVTALAVRGGTQAKGATELNQLVPVLDFFYKQILPELQTATPAAMVLKADALKFFSAFRQQVWFHNLV